MTPKIIELKQAPVVLVEFQNSSFSMIHDGFYVMGVSEYDVSLKIKKIQHGDYKGFYNLYRYGGKVIGILSGLSEEQFAECVEREIFTPDNSIKSGYRNYVGNKYDWFGTSKESFHSLLNSENVYTENPLGDKAPAAIVMVGGMELLNVNGRIAKENRRRLEKWQEAQSRTIDPKRTVVLLRKDY